MEKSWRERNVGGEEVTVEEVEGLPGDNSCDGHAAPVLRESVDAKDFRDLVIGSVFDLIQ